MSLARYQNLTFLTLLIYHPALLGNYMDSKKDISFEKLDQLINSPIENGNEAIVIVMKLRRYFRFAMIDQLLKENLKTDLVEYLTAKHQDEKKSIRDITAELNSDIENILEKNSNEISKKVLEIRNKMLDTFSKTEEVTEKRIDSAIFGSDRTPYSERFDYEDQNFWNSLLGISKNSVTNIMKALTIETRNYYERHTERYTKKRGEKAEQNQNSIEANFILDNIFINTIDKKGYILCKNGKKERLFPGEIEILLLLHENKNYHNASELIEDFRKIHKIHPSQKESGVTKSSIYRLVHTLRKKLIKLTKYIIPQKAYSLKEQSISR